MKADLDFDIVAHLGYLRNIDLLCKGIYIVQVKLYYGLNGRLIAPVGMFSSPSTVASVVQGQTLPTTPICSMCEVDDRSRSFRTRAFIVRYKDERFELNDGVHWRLTIPSCEMPSNDDFVAPHCEKLLHLKFELLYAPFLESETKVDLLHDVHKLVPDDPVYSVLSTQNIVVEKASSGIHTFYPVNFNGDNIIELDCMIHCAITGMRFPSLVPRADIITDLPSAPEKTTELDAESSSTDQAVRPLPPLPPTTTATATVTATSTDNKTVDKGEAQIVPDPVEENAPVTPVKGKTTEDLGAGQQKTPERTEATTAENEFVTPIKRGSHRYVPILSPHSTVMATPNETEGTPQTRMQRMSGRITNWRKSVTAIASPAPLLEKVGDVKAASVRRLSALTSALSSPIAGAASILRMDGVKGASPMRDETVTPARTEELSHQQLQEVGQEEGTSTTKAMTADDSVAAASVNSLAQDLDVVAVHSPKPHQRDTNSDSNTDTDTSLTGNNREDNREDAQLTAALEQRALPVEAAEALSPELDPVLHPEQWLQAYTHSVICNYQAAHAGISAIIDLYTYVQAHEDIETSVSSGKTTISSTTTAETLQALCLLQSNYTEIIEELLVYSDEKERIAILKEKIDLCNLQVTLHWSLLMTALRRVMPQLCPLLKAQYRIVARRFWRGQVLVQTKSYTDTNCHRPLEIQLLLDLLARQITEEGEERHLYHKSTNSICSSYSTERALRVYDADLHKNMSKLPHMVLQQYVDKIDPSKISLAQLNARLAAGNSSNSSSGSNGSIAPSKGAPEECSILGRMLERLQPALSGKESLSSGTLLLSRGGELLHEIATTTTATTASTATGGIVCAQHMLSSRDGQVVDLFQQSLGTLKPFFNQKVSEGLMGRQQNFEVTDEAVQVPDTIATATAAVVSVSEASSTIESNINMPKQETNKKSGQSILSNGETGRKEGAFSGRSSEISTKTATVSSTEATSSRSKIDFVSAYKQLHPVSTTATTTTNSSSSSGHVHLIVLQHGFLGHSGDMQLIENALRLEFPGVIETFLPRSNEGREQDSIAQMGKRLAFELAHYCKEYRPDLLRPGGGARVSFVGHSMGGLIVRQALTEASMKPLFSKLYTFISLATPHVGSRFPDSKLVSTGMWALFKWKKYKALKELVLEDSLGGKATKTLLYKMSESTALAHFRRLVLASSPKDSYVPAYSARIQTCAKSATDAVGLGQTVGAMVENLLQPLRADQVVRLTMDNNVGESVDVNSLIGRTAHICYLDNPVAALMLVQTIAPYLE